ncbi:MAG TPA: hypothetical protein VI197_23340 [Polyangiaceae bacterium]
MAEVHKNTVVFGGAGKTGRRVADRLSARGWPVRLASRSTQVPFDWTDEGTWSRALAGANLAYLTYFPDLAIPGAADAVRRFTRAAASSGVEKLVLLAGRGEPQVHPAEQAVRDSGIAFTILECAFFNQNFNEGLLAPVDGVIAFPATHVGEPLLDCDDVADVAVAALIDDAHAGQTYELTGPRVLTFEQATSMLAEASGQPLRYQPMSFEAYASVLAPYLPPEQVAFTIDLFRWVLDGHNASVSDGVERVLGRKPKEFAAFVRDALRAA